VPKVLKALVPEVVGSFLKQVECRPADIRFWGIHPGGARIVDYVGEALALPQEALTCSRQVMRQYGNISSATNFFVLERIIQEGQPQSGDRAVLLGFGPGLTIELALLTW
jgi:predicted naringenin-chalcone synthase